MIVTSLKSMDEIRHGGIFALPLSATLEPWRQAWSTRLHRRRLRGPAHRLPELGGDHGAVHHPADPDRRRQRLRAVVLAPALREPAVRGADGRRLRAGAGDDLSAGAGLALAGVFGSLPAIVLVHLVFGMPMMTLLFRNYYCSVPHELFQAARVDGGGFWRIFLR
jgi:glucose/mannose transport system permease protein